MKLIEAATKKLTPEEEAWIQKYMGGMWSAYKVVKGRLNTSASTKPIVLHPKAESVGVPFGKVKGFKIDNNPHIVDCTNFPTMSYNDVVITKTNLKTLEGFTQEVRGDIVLQENKISSFKGLPEETKGSLHLSRNSLTSFEHCPKRIGGGLSVSYNNISSIEHLPEHITRNLWMGENKLTTLSGINKKLRYCGGKIDIGGNPITGGLLGVILIEGCKGLSTSGGSTSNTELDRACEIINKYVGKGKQGVLDAQAELEEHDLDDYGEL